MNVLVTGRGTSGSWAIRGVQLGAAIGATVQRDAPRLNGYDLVVIVKRVRPEYLSVLHEKKTPIVWDIVDAWPQPGGNEWDRTACMGWLREEVKRLAPVALVVSTSIMQRDCAEFGLPTLVLPHHARPNQRANPIREHVETIGYEGALHYLGRWQDIVAEECRPLGWRFEVNPLRLSDVDIVVGLRCQNGYAARNWKSNVKLANAQGSGTPCIMNREQGYLETAQLGVAWADDLAEFRLALKVFSNYRMRKASSEQLLASQPKLENIATTYRAWLGGLAA